MKTLWLLLVLVSPLFLKAQDTIPPVIQNFWTSDTVFLQVFNSFHAITPPIKVMDAVDGNVTTDAKFDTVPDSTQLGYYNVTYTAQDKSGNMTQASIVVEVGDTLYPMITMHGDSVVYLKVGDTNYMDPGVTVTDNILFTILESGTYQKQVLSAGQYWTTYTAEDQAGNKVCATRTFCIGQGPSQCGSVGVKGCHQRVVTSVLRLAPAAISVYPNPSNGSVQVEMDDVIKDLNVYTLEGKLALSAQPWSRTTSIDLLEPGLYVLHVQTAKSNTRTLVKVQ